MLNGFKRFIFVYAVSQHVHKLRLYTAVRVEIGRQMLALEVLIRRCTCRGDKVDRVVNNEAGVLQSHYRRSLCLNDGATLMQAPGLASRRC